MKALVNHFDQRLVSKTQLNLKNSLLNGQAFCWSFTDQKYIGVLGNMVLQFDYDENDIVQYQCLNNVTSITYHGLKTVEHALSVFFRLDQDLDELITTWRKDKYFSDVGSKITGVRMLNQEPLECFISFMVSQNNNIKRITTTLDSLRRQYGTKLITYNNRDYYQFPSVAQLLCASEDSFKELGLGYRASYLHDTIQSLQSKGGESYLNDMIGTDPEVILKKLLEFKGVGNKVADCIRLFSLGCSSIVPVDTHIYQIYQNKYANKSQSKKKLTTSSYQDIQLLFEKKFGENAGWAHSFLFTAELPEFKAPLQIKVDDEKQPSKSKSKNKIIKKEIFVEEQSSRKKQKK